MVKLDLDPTREEVPPRDAATIIVVRDAPSGMEVFCVERHPKSGFLGGAVVFPGGKVDPGDASDEWSSVVSGGDDDRAMRIAACREALEEAAILPLSGGSVAHDDLLVLRARLERKEGSLIAFLRERALSLDLGALHPFARWITPVAEARRYDTRFYLAMLPPNQQGAHDEHETTSSFWARPSDVIARWDAGKVALAPPTHRTLEILAQVTTSAEAIALAAAASKEPICPLVTTQDGTVALVLPGDPEHDVREARVPGRSRYVLRGDKFVPEDAPGR
jgi:8-oxo-dGTP pyrophosphatase MutT (NUDIX family)